MAGFAAPNVIVRWIAAQSEGHRTRDLRRQPEPSRTINQSLKLKLTTNHQLLLTATNPMKPSFFLTLLAPMLLAGSLQAASDYLLEIDGIKGESSDAMHPGAIEIESFSWGATNPGDTSVGGLSFTDLRITTKIGKASPQLMLACATRNRISKATLYIRRPGETKEEYYKVEMADVLVSSYQSSGSSMSTSGETDSRPTEEVAFYYNKVSVLFTDPDGSLTTGQATRILAQ